MIIAHCTLLQIIFCRPLFGSQNSAHQLGGHDEELLGVLHHEGGHARQDRVARLQTMRWSGEEEKQVLAIQF